MIRFKHIAALVFSVSSLFAATGASNATAAGEFGIKSFDEVVYEQGSGPFKHGPADRRAGRHPFAITNSFELTTEKDPLANRQKPAEAGVRKAFSAEFPGLIGNPYAVPQCTKAEFQFVTFEPHCFDDAQVGYAEVALFEEFRRYPMYNLTPGYGEAAAFGFWVATVPVIVTARLRNDSDYGVTVEGKNIDETLGVTGVKITLWGVPGSPVHNGERGVDHNLSEKPPACSPEQNPSPCPAHGGAPKAFLTMPVDCAHGPMETHLSGESWKGATDSATAISHDDSGNPIGMQECHRVPFNPTIEAQPSSGSTETASGLKFQLNVPDTGILNPDGIAQSTIKKAVVKLPEGMGINPSAGEGLGACTPADWQREKQLETLPNLGCPNQSKIGSVRIKTPVLNEEAEGSLFLAQADDPRTSRPGAENPFDSLLSMYIVARIPARGIIVSAEGKVEPDPRTGQLTTTFDGLPPLPFSQLILNFREGGRAPLSTPRTCGTYAVRADLTPWSAMSPADVTPVESTFSITSGVGGGSCPSGGNPPFRPGLLAGTISNSAGTYSPFDLQLTRNDGEQEFTHFSIKLPPGISGKLAGVPFCSDQAINAARSRTATAELESPSCPKASEIGSTLVGSGVGSILTYVPGKVYLAGSYNGSALSIAAITAAKVGPFDVGTVVIRQALKINPETAEVFIDSANSDPIPHIVKGIPVHARDIRVSVDKPEFVLNPTSCKRTSTASTVLGSGLNLASSFDDQPFTATSPFQAADCASLGFKPKLQLSLRGGIKRGDNPRFRAVLTARKGDANIGEAQVTLPHSEFLDNEHIKTICTRAQFAQGVVPGEKCPKASIYGYAKAITPILDEPIEGPVFLRSSSHQLPDLVAALHSGKININLDGRIDSVEGGRIRNTFEEVPDAPVTKFTLTMQGGKKGLLINSRDLCKAPARAKAAFTGQNGKVSNSNPEVVAQCKKKSKAKGKSKKR